MRTHRLVVLLALVATCGQLVAAPAPQGTFVLPFNEAQSWPAEGVIWKAPIDWSNPCPSIGWSERTQYHMQLNEDLTVPKYHMGEDWNGKCGSNSDEGAPLYALADGEVRYLDNLGKTPTAQGRRIHIRYAFPYTLGSGGIFYFDSVYMHLSTVSDAIVQEAGLAAGATSVKVTKKQLVGKVGKTGVDIMAHLHWEARSNLNLATVTNPYQATLTKTFALNYRAPSLIVDDRRDEITVTIPSDQSYTGFSMATSAPFSTAYITYAGQRKTLKNAISAGWITSSGFQWLKSGVWTNWNYSTSSKEYLRYGSSYRIKSVVPNATLNIPVPRHNFQQDRARFDMIYSVAFDSRFTGIDTEIYDHDADWSSDFELHTMQFETTLGPSLVYQATHKADPLWRFTCYWDRLKGAYSPWVQVNPNRLY